MHRSILLLFGLVFYSVHCLSITISGMVTGTRNQALPNVVVELATADNQHVLRSTQTDNNGNFRLDFLGKADSLKIRMLGFNIEKQARSISAQTQQLILKAVEKDIRIQEVVVYTKQVWRKKDTLNYLVSRFTRFEDQAIGDVLRKLPWISVQPDGSIQYMDKSINSFSIESVDLSRSRFGLATTLFKPQDVFIIQVFRKRTIVKKRRSIQIAINLKLK